MAIQFHCPSCNALVSVEDQHVGKQVKCAHCQETCTAPSAPTAEPEAAAIQVEAPVSVPNPAADAATAITDAPRKPRSGREAERWAPERRRDIERSSFSPVWILLLVCGLFFGGVFALMCVGFGAGLFFGFAGQLAPEEVEIADEVMVAPRPIEEKRVAEIKIDNAIGKNKMPIVTPLDAVVKGAVKLRGKAPEAKPAPRMAEHADAKYCLSGPAKHKAEQIWMVGKDNAVANVVVSLAPPPGKKFMIDDGLKKLSKKTVKIDQPFCAFDPHVVALWPETQGLVFLNSAEIAHNVKISGGAKIGNIDFMLKPRPKGGAPSASDELYLKGGGEAVIDASCAIHTWMNAKIALFTHPYCAVTKEDGSFEIPNVPIDELLTVYLWHESDPLKVEVQKLKTVKGVNELQLVYPAGN